MIELQDEMLLYHGSYTAIPKIDLKCCFGGFDFECQLEFIRSDRYGDIKL